MRIFYEVPSVQIYELDMQEVVTASSGLNPGGDQKTDETGDDYEKIFGF